MGSRVKMLFPPVAAASLLVGCTTQEVARVGEEPREAITHAATARYPGNAQRSDRVQVAALDDPEGRELTLA